MATIWILDDTPADRAAIRRVLENNGHDIREFDEDGPAFEALASGRVPDLVLLDLALPRKGGSTTLTRLAREFPDTKVLVTARSGETISTRAFLRVANDLGTVRALPKPFSASKLIHAIGIMLRGGEWSREHPHPSESKP